MSAVKPDMSIQELLKLAVEHHQQRVTLSDSEKQLLIALLKQRGSEELEYGQEIELENVRLVKRVTGAVGVYFA